MATSHWKNIERKICKAFKGSRSGPLGKETCDCIGTEPFAVEIKHGKYATPNKRLMAFMEQAHSNVKGQAERCPVLVLHPLGSDLGKSWVCFEMKDFREWFL
jgi:hypothetical protein